MKVSIIIAVKEFNQFLQESIKSCLQLHFHDFEILVLPDRVFDFPDDRVRIIPTGSCLPAQKRDVGAARAHGEILAFLDDDAYPAEHWLDEAVRDFEDPDVAAVGGPAVTPPGEGERMLASGLVYETPAASGKFRYRYIPMQRQYVDDYPSCNLLVRKSIFDQLGGFKTNFWPGEDTILCLEITKRLKKKILYDPGVLVFHHRRPLFSGHLKQVTNYALHRGYFVKRFPETSLRWQYFLPSALFLWFLAGAFFAWLNPVCFILFLASFILYATIVLSHAWQRNSLSLSMMVAAGIALTHLSYGIFFILGIFSSKLREEEAV